jgi:hypothetical protein
MLTESIHNTMQRPHDCSILSHISVGSLSRLLHWIQDEFGEHHNCACGKHGDREYRWWGSHIGQYINQTPLLTSGTIINIENLDRGVRGGCSNVPSVLSSFG